MLKKEKRLRKSRDFSRVYEHGKKAVGRYFVLRYLDRKDEGLTKIGIAVGRKIGGAVSRNRLKRSVREICRQILIKDGYDIVIVARGGANLADFHNLRKDIEDLLRRTGLMNEDKRLNGLEGNVK